MWFLNQLCSNTRNLRRLDQPNAGNGSANPLRSPAPMQIRRLDAQFPENGPRIRGNCYDAPDRIVVGRCNFRAQSDQVAGSAKVYSPLILRESSPTRVWSLGKSCIRQAHTQSASAAVR
jgi:hypothetical protein